MKVSPVKSDIRFVKDFGNKGLREVAAGAENGWRDVASAAYGFGGGAISVTQQFSQ